MDLYPTDLPLSKDSQSNTKGPLLYDEVILWIFLLAYTITYPRNQVKSCLSLGVSAAPDSDSSSKWGQPRAGITDSYFLSTMTESLPFLFLEHFPSSDSQNSLCFTIPYQEITALKIRNVFLTDSQYFKPQNYLFFPFSLYVIILL